MPSITATPATFTSDASAGTVAWSNPSRALASDDDYTVASVGPLESTQRLRGVAADFGAIPEGSAVVGIAPYRSRSSANEGNWSPGLSVPLRICSSINW